MIFVRRSRWDNKVVGGPCEVPAWVAAEDNWTDEGVPEQIPRYDEGKHDWVVAPAEDWEARVADDADELEWDAALGAKESEGEEVPDDFDLW